MHLWNPPRGPETPPYINSETRGFSPPKNRGLGGFIFAIFRRVLVVKAQFCSQTIILIQQNSSYKRASLAYLGDYIMPFYHALPSLMDNFKAVMCAYHIKWPREHNFWATWLIEASGRLRLQGSGAMSRHRNDDEVGQIITVYENCLTTNLLVQLVDDYWLGLLETCVSRGLTAPVHFNLYIVDFAAEYIMWLLAK